MAAPQKAPSASASQLPVLIPNSENRDWLTPAEVRSLRSSTVMSRLKAISGLVAANAREAEEIRQPVDDVISAIRKTGLFYLYVPKKFGGRESDDLTMFLDSIALIAEGCASTAWCVGFTLSHQCLLANFSEELQQEIWSETPYVTTAGGGFPPGRLTKVRGGFRATGRWKFGTGIMHSQWTSSVALLEEADETKVPYYFFVPVDQVTVLDSWYVDGMCGTGSHDYEMQGVFVPEYRAMDHRILMRGQLHHKTLIYRYPLAPFLAPLGVAVMVGAARGAVKTFRERLATGGSGFREKTETKAAVDNPRIHAALGQADMQVTAASLMMGEAVAQLERLGVRDEYMSVDDRVRIRTLCSYAANQCVSALRVLNDEGGTSAHDLSNPIQRALRDVTMLATHVAYDYTEAMQLQGRVMSGLPSNNPAFQ